MRTTIIKYPHNTLKESRKAKSLTQEQVARLLNLQCEDRLSRWEHGQALPSVENLFRLAKLYEVSPEELYPDSAVRQAA